MTLLLILAVALQVFGAVAIWRRCMLADESGALPVPSESAAAMACAAIIAIFGGLLFIGAFIEICRGIWWLVYGRKK